MNFYKEIKKLWEKVNACCNGGADDTPPSSYPTPAAAQADSSLPVGSLYYIDGTVPGSGFKGEAYIKY